MKKILAFGEVLWDMLPSGKQIGGAPGNFAYHCRVCGCDAVLISRIGTDALGDEVVTVFDSRRVPTQFISRDSARPTGTVEVTLRNGQPSYRIVENVAWDAIEADNAVLDWVKDADAVCFGSLACRSEQNRRTLNQILARLHPKAEIVFDLNLRAPFYSADLIADLLPKCTIFKLNDEELAVLADFSGKPFADSVFLTGTGASAALNPEKRSFVEKLMQENGLKCLILTCGAAGSFLFCAKGEESFVPATPVEVVSTVGAGDAFTAVCVAGLLAGEPLSEINRRASEYAAYVCTQPGGMPEPKTMN